MSKSLKASKQDFDERLKIAPKLSKENTRIDWNKSQKEIIGMIRGLSPNPGAWTILKNGDNEIRMKILEAKKSNSLSAKKVGKFLINNGEIHICNGVDSINCTYIQLENRKAMSAKELINGLKIYENSYVY